ncbi:hypothetical protein [Parasphingorhabdus sp.]|uniref:hypothetical protein n=1 Tax=Parasphingorhabdus sp. TaxID=2709688 RepID=UPI002B276ABC|nr:hypothetical protein [Parasphingorhabdus sp.]
MNFAHIKNFSDIKNEILTDNPDWLWVNKIPDDSPVDVKEFSWGDEIPNKQGDPFSGNTIQLAIVMVGQVEVVEIYRFKKDYKAFRPIRILRQGDVFNDFKMVDKYVFSAPPESRPGEKWHIRAGCTASISIGTTTNQDLFRATIGGKEDFGVDSYLKNSFGENELVKIAYVSLDIDRISEELMIEVFKTAWRRSYTYRESPNSFNFQSKIRYLNRAVPKFSKLTKSVGRFQKITEKELESTNQKTVKIVRAKQANNNAKKYPHSVLHQAIEPIFYDAIYDALNRPIRKEPVFFKYRSADSDGVQVLVADYAENNSCEFYFPIDLNNHFICQYFGAMCNLPHLDDPNEGERSMAQHYSADEILKAFGTAEAAREPKKIENGADGKKWNFGNGANFWKESAEYILDAYLANCPNGDYPFNVSVKSEKDFKGRPILLLEFHRKNGNL